jgi:GNAT superfamily N-acetyltransferase
MIGLRKADRNDMPRLTEIRMAVTENVLTDPRSVRPADVTWFLDNAAIWVLELEGVVRGFAAGDPRDASVWALFVEPGYEGRGFGRTLMRRICDEFVENGTRNVWLRTGAGTRADRFYRRDGWVEDGVHPTGDLIFRKQLGVNA